MTWKIIVEISKLEMTMCTHLDMELPSLTATLGGRELGTDCSSGKSFSQAVQEQEKAYPRSCGSNFQKLLQCDHACVV